MNRRSLLGALAMGTSSLAMANPGTDFLGFLTSAEGEEKVRAIINKYVPLRAEDDPFLTDFYKSLLVAKNHSKDEKFFREHLSKTHLEERLESYIIEEFFTRTNYLMVKAGEAKTLKISL